MWWLDIGYNGLTQNNSQGARTAYSDGACVSRLSVREWLVFYNSITTRGGMIGPMALDDTT